MFILFKGRSDFFFFSSRRRHTRCSRDWSSDVCSSSSSRMRVLGWTKRVVGTVKPSGSSGLGTSLLVCGTATGGIGSGLLVPVIAFAVVRAAALSDLGPTLVVVAGGALDASPFRPDHGCNSIN